MAELYEVRLLDGERSWSVGWVVEKESDRLLGDGATVLLFDGRAALEHYAGAHGLRVEPDPPDELDLDLGGWLSAGRPEPAAAEVAELWHLLLEHPAAGRPLQGDAVEEAYDDLVEQEPGWFALHGPAARAALQESVRRLRRATTPYRG